MFISGVDLEVAAVLDIDRLSSKLTDLLVEEIFTYLACVGILDLDLSRLSGEQLAAADAEDRCCLDRVWYAGNADGGLDHS